MPNEVVHIFHATMDCFLRKELAARGSKFFPLREVPIFKGNAIDENHSHLSSLPKICINISVVWLRCYVFIAISNV